MLFPEILAWNVALDNADCYGTSDGLAGHIKNAFLTVSSEQRKKMNALYKLRNVDNSLNVNSDYMVYDKSIGS